MKLWVFRNEPGTSYYFCTKQPEPIFKDDMKGVVYTDYGTLVGGIPIATFEALFPALKFEGGGYRQIVIDSGANNIEGTAYYNILGRTR